MKPHPLTREELEQERAEYMARRKTRAEDAFKRIRSNDALRDEAYRAWPKRKPKGENG